MSAPRRSRAARAYRRLCRIYPAPFPERFGAGLEYGFARDRADASARGRRALLAFWILTLTDLLRFGLGARLGPTSPSPATLQEGATMTSLAKTDLRDAWRSLWSTPIVTAVAVLSLALGIGANTALFSILNGLVLKSLPVHEPARLALLEGGDWTNPIWEQIRQRETELASGALAWSATRFDLAESGETDLVDGALVSGRMFEVLGVSAALGRTLNEADDVRGGGSSGPAAVISHRLWQRRFGAAQSVIGQRITVERVPFTIVGVAPDGFYGPEVGRSMDLVIPIGAEPLIRGAESALDARSAWWLTIMLRLRPGDSVDAATARLRGVQAQIRAATAPERWPAAEQSRYLTEPFTLSSASTGLSYLRQRYVQPLAVLLTVVGLVLLIACANIAGLLLARAVARRHEFSVRLALGASRFRLSRQLLAESLIIAGAGALLGLAFARWASGLLVSQLTTLSGAVSIDLSLDWRVLAFTTAVTCATVLLFGLAPAFGVSVVAPQEALREQGRGAAGVGRLTLRHALVVMQVALSLTLVVGALLFGRTFGTLAARDLGFDRDPVLIMNVSARRSTAPQEQRAALFEQLRDAAAAVPGVARAAASFTSPTASSGWNMSVKVAPDSTLGRRERMTWINAVTPGWFDTYGMRLLAGRDVHAADRAGGPAVAVVNQAFAARFLEPGNPVGQQFSPGDGFSDTRSYEVIGLVPDAVYRSVRAEMMPIAYIPLAQWPQPSAEVVISLRSAGAPPGALAKSVTAALLAAEPRLAVSYHPLRKQVDAALIQERLLANMSVFFGALALLLAGLGLYGVTSYAVNSRRTEIGIRMALGATAAAVVRLVLRRVAWLVLIGITAGSALSLWATRFVGSLLYGLEPQDPASLAAAALLLAAAGTLAGWLPARRAARTDPTVVLRES